METTATSINLPAFAAPEMDVPQKRGGEVNNDRTPGRRDAAQGIGSRGARGPIGCSTRNLPTRLRTQCRSGVECRARCQLRPCPLPLRLPRPRPGRRRGAGGPGLPPQKTGYTAEKALVLAFDSINCKRLAVSRGSVALCESR